MTFTEIFYIAKKEVEYYKDIFQFNDNKKYEGINIKSPHEIIAKISGFICCLVPAEDGNFNDIRNCHRFFPDIGSTNSEYSLKLYKARFNKNEYTVRFYIKNLSSIVRYKITLERFNVDTLDILFKDNMTIYDLYDHFYMFKKVNEYAFFN